MREHGLALWIEAHGMRLLFDTGQGTTVIANAAALGIRPSSADAIILSHGHYDHTGGLPQILEQAEYPHLFCHPSVLCERYRVHDGIAKSIGIPEAARRALEQLPSGRFCATTEPFLLSSTIGITGAISRNTAYEDTGGPFYLDPAASQSDLINDDMALWIKTSKGIVVCVGCSHAGIVNILHHVIALAGGSERIRAIIGGLHLTSASDERIERTVHSLRQFSPELIIPCHCSGERAIMALSEAFPSILRIGHAGMSVALL